MVERTTGRGWTAGMARVLAGAGGWIAVAAFVAPWSTRDGDVLVGLTRTLGVAGFGVYDVEGRQYVDWVATVHGVDAWLLPLAAVALWFGAVRWRAGSRVEVLAAAALLLVLGVTGVVLPLVTGDGAILWYGPHLALVAGLAGLAGWFLARRTPPGRPPERPGEARLRDAVVDLDLAGHVAPRLVRVFWAVLATALVGGYLVSVVAGVFELLRLQEFPAAGDVLAVVLGVAGGLVVVLAALVVLRAVADLLVVPFRIVDLLRTRMPATADEAPTPAPEPASTPEPEPTPTVEPPREPDVPASPEPERQPPPAPPPRPAPPDRPEPRTPPAPAPRPAPPPQTPPAQPRARPSAPPRDTPSAPRHPVPPSEVAAEPEPWVSRPRPSAPPSQPEGTADQSYRGPSEGPSAVPEARGIPGDDPAAHPLRRGPDDEDGGDDDA